MIKNQNFLYAIAYANRSNLTFFLELEDAQPEDRWMRCLHGLRVIFLLNCLLVCIHSRVIFVFLVKAINDPLLVAIFDCYFVGNANVLAF